jgi:hypothetical protein
MDWYTFLCKGKTEIIVLKILAQPYKTKLPGKPGAHYMCTLSYLESDTADTSAVESVHKTSDSNSSVFKTPTPS